jgi:predicted enzyme related to lactoylglutathione lyase
VEPGADPIEVKDVITEIKVRDATASREWYTKLFGKPPDLEPFPGNIEFKIGGAWIQISRGDVKPSSWTILFEVRDLQKERERLIASGIEVPPIGLVPDVISWFDLSDPDGNSMRWFQVLTKDSTITGVSS